MARSFLVCQEKPKIPAPDFIMAYLHDENWNRALHGNPAYELVEIYKTTFGAMSDSYRGNKNKEVFKDVPIYFVVLMTVEYKLSSGKPTRRYYAKHWSVTLGINGSQRKWPQSLDDGFASKARVIKEIKKYFVGAEKSFDELFPPKTKNSSKSSTFNKTESKDG